MDRGGSASGTSPVLLLGAETLQRASSSSCMQHAAWAGTFTILHADTRILADYFSISKPAVEYTHRSRTHPDEKIALPAVLYCAVPPPRSSQASYGPIGMARAVFKVKVVGHHL